MKFKELLGLVSDVPVFESGLLLAGDRDPNDVRRQLSRWTSAGKILQLKRGLYALAPPYRKTEPHPFLVANQLVRGSYVSLQSALAYYSMIPEHVPMTLSITTRSPVSWENPLGIFQFHHIVQDLFTGYRSVEVVSGQQAFVATPEKALLDLVHLTAGSAAAGYLDELRLQNLGQLDTDRLQKLAADRPKLRRAAENILRLARVEESAYEPL